VMPAPAKRPIRPAVAKMPVDEVYITAKII
jgi:hypothetical protein